MLSTKYRLVLQFGHSFLQNYYKPFFFDLLKAFLGLFLFLFFCWKGWRGKFFLNAIGIDCFSPSSSFWVPVQIIFEKFSAI